MVPEDTSETEFIQHFIQNAPQMMWLLGAGTSRTAGMPTATDICWDLKRRYYCLQENQNVSDHDINKGEIKKKIQNYLDGKGSPQIWSPEEYSYYFKLVFGDDLSAQQKYIKEQLSPEKISLSIGHRAISALIKMGLSKIIFTTNFDEVLEKSYAEMTGEILPSYHLEGSYAALEALNTESFPIFAKMHGDFRYQSIKNLSEDLLSNDKEIQQCFEAASNRYGLIVSGYSGRDENIMSMIESTLSASNAYPHGIWWAVTQKSNTPDTVITLIDKAKEKGVNANIIEVGTFDIMMLKIWRQIQNKPNDLNFKVRSGLNAEVSINLPEPGKNYPILRTNALALIDIPTKCGSVICKKPMTYSDMTDAIVKSVPRPKSLFTFTDRVLFWGDSAEVGKVFGGNNSASIEEYVFDDPISEISKSTFLKFFFEKGVVTALCDGKPLNLRKKGRTYYIVVSKDHVNDHIFNSLKLAVGYKGNPGYISGNVRNIRDTYWAEAISVNLEERDGRLWLLIRPDIWISPLSNRTNSVEFLRGWKLKRWNRQAYQILDAWIDILLSQRGDADVEVSCFKDAEYSPSFTINARTAFSRKGAA